MKIRGIGRTPHGWRVYTKIQGRYRSKHFPADTPVPDLRRELAKLQARATLAIEEPHATGDTLGDDCTRYLAIIAGMPTFSDRKYRILEWKNELGASTKREDITAADLRLVFARWKARGLSDGSLNLRRTALMHLWTMLDGKQAPNPVREIARYREVPPRLDLPTWKDATAAINRMSDDGLSKLRLRVLLWTGWPPSQLMKMTAADVNWKKKIARVPARRKGEGVAARWLPLLPNAVHALKALDAADGWGRFSIHSLRHRLHAACRAADVQKFRVYDLRHLFLTTVAGIVKDDRVVSELAQHSTLEQARRYTEHSVSPRLTSALSAVGRRLQPLQHRKVSERKRG